MYWVIAIVAILFAKLSLFGCTITHNCPVSPQTIALDKILRQNQCLVRIITTYGPDCTTSTYEQLASELDDWRLSNLPTAMWSVEIEYPYEP
jgi:hypothetical protein